MIAARLMVAIAIVSAAPAFAAEDPAVTRALEEARQANLRRDFTTAQGIYQRLADDGHSEGLVFLGTVYYGGIGVERSLPRGCDYWQQATDKGDSFAMHLLGDCYFKGLGRERDYQKSLALYGKAAEGGQITAHCAMGNQYFEGLGVTKDVKRAVELCTKAADLGSADAQTDLGARYRRGHGVARMPAQAEALLLRATKQGHINAAVDLGEMYLVGDGIPKNPGEAARLFRMVEAAKDPRAPYWVGKYFAAQLPAETDSAYMPILAKVAWWYSVAARVEPIKDHQEYARIEAQKIIQERPAIRDLAMKLRQEDAKSFLP